MPTAAAARAAAGTPPAKPTTTRVTVLTGRRMSDLVLPAVAPMESYIDDTIAVLAEMLEDTPEDVLAGFNFAAQGTWTFARPGGLPLKLDQSLDDAGIVDGSLLTPVSVSHTERYRPLVEDVIDAIAVLDESPEFDRASLYRFIGLAIPPVTLAATVIATLAWGNTGHHLWWSLALGITGLLVLGGSFAAKKVYQQIPLSENLLAAAFPPIAAALGLTIPFPRGVTSLGAPQLAGAAAAILLLALATRGGPRGRVELATFTVVTTIATTAAAIAFGYGGSHWVPAGAVVLGLITVTNAAKLTVAVARIALPPIPAPGETVAHEELLDPVEADEATDQETPTWQAIIASVPESAARLTERSKLTKQLLSGFITSGTLVLAAGAIAVPVRGHFFVHGLLVAGLVTVACGFRCRLYADPWCAWAVLAAAVAVPTGVATRLSLWYPSYAWLILTLYLFTGMLVVAVVAARSSLTRVSPVMKRMLELLDGALVAAILPMLLWLTGVYDMVRNIRF